MRPSSFFVYRKAAAANSEKLSVAFSSNRAISDPKELVANHLKENNNSKDADVDWVIVGSGFRRKIEMGLVVPSTQPNA